MLSRHLSCWFLTKVWERDIASNIEQISLTCMVNQLSMPATRKPFISFTLCMSSLWVSSNLYHRLWQAEKYLACFQKRYERGLPKRPCSPSISIGLFDMHTWISLFKALWHQYSVNGPIGRQAESTSLPPTLIYKFEWWDVAKAMHSGTDHSEVVYHYNIISQTHRKATLLNWGNTSLQVLVYLLDISYTL